MPSHVFHTFIVFHMFHVFIVFHAPEEHGCYIYSGAYASGGVDFTAGTCYLDIAGGPDRIR